VKGRWICALVGAATLGGAPLALAEHDAEEPSGAPPAVVAPPFPVPTAPQPAPTVPPPPPTLPPPPPAPGGPGGAGAGDADRPLGDEEAMVLNFERADIREVIHSLATALGLSYTIDPRIEGQITIRTTGKIAREDLFPLFNSILRNNGIAAVKVGDLYQIVPVAEAKTRAIIPRSKDAKARARAEDSFVIEIVPVQHVAADEMVNVLTPFLTPGGDALSYPRGNVVVITDLESNIARLRELAATFDTDVFQKMHTKVFKMQHGDPDELANELLGILAPYGVTPTGDGEGGLYMIPLSRLNAIIVVAFDKTIFAEVERWLKLLDIPPDEESGRQTIVYNVENTKAADLADVLNQLFGGGPGGPGGVGGLGRNPGAAPAGVGLFGAGGVSGGRGGTGGALGGSRGGLGGGGGGVGGGFGQTSASGIGGATTAGQTTPGSLGSTGGTGGRLGGGRGGAGSLGGGAGGAAAGRAGQAGGGGAVGISLPGGPAAAGTVPGQPPGPPPIFKQEVRIVADEVTNSLVILATKRDYRLILDVIKRIDVVPRQVMLEVTIAEVQLNKDFQFGVSWALSQGALGSAFPNTTGTGGNASNPAAGNPLFTNSSPGTSSTQTTSLQGNGDPITSTVNKTLGSNAVGGLLGNALQVPAAGGFLVLTDKHNFNMFLNALQSRTNVKMLSAPHIIAADNREAHILVGQSVPILTSTASSTLTSNFSQVNTVQYRDTGKILTVLPQVNSKGLVNMQIRQEVSSVSTDATTAAFNHTNSPVFNTREAETTVVVQDGEGVIIGGIIDDQISHVRSGIPFLMDIPVLGVAFRSDNDTVERTELIILITPYVIRNREEARDVTEDFSARVEGFRRLRRAMQPDRHRRTSESQEDEAPIPMDADRYGPKPSAP
jgi:general secretion pathway protein D